MSSLMPREGRARRASAAAGILAIVVTLLATTVGLASPASAEVEPELSIGPGQVRLGATMDVVGNGFRSGSQVTLEICGVPGADGRFTCTTVREGLTVPAGGRFSERVPVKEPAGPCPCVLKVSVPERRPVTASLDISGVAVASKVESPQVVVDGASLEGGSGPLTWFTGSASPDLVMTVRNAGAAPAQPTLYLWAGKPGAGPDGAAVDDPGVPLLQPAESVTVRVPFEYANRLGGAYSVEGYVAVGDIYEPVRVEARILPWGLYLLALGAVAAIVVGVRRVRNGPAPSGTSHRAGARRAEGARRLSVAQPAQPTGPAAPVRAPAARNRPRRGAVDAGPVGPPRLAETPIDRSHLPRSSEPLAPALVAHVGVIGPVRAAVAVPPTTQGPTAQEPATQPIAVQAAAPVAPAVDRVTSYLEATAPEMLRGRRARSSVALDPLTAPIDEVTGQFPVVAPPPLDLPAPPMSVSFTAPITPERGMRRADVAPAPVVYEEPVPVQVARPEPVPSVIAPAQVGAPSMAEALRARAAQRDRSIVTGAMEAIREHTADAPAHLPDQYGFVPEQRDRRSSKGGKRAAR